MPDNKDRKRFHGDCYAVRYCRTEEMKRIRREIGDRGGIKFKGKRWALRSDCCVNTLTGILKDNYIVIIEHEQDN